MVELRVGLQDGSAFVQYKRVGCEGCVGISRCRPLLGLTNAVCVDELALHGIPKAGVLQYFDRRFAVGRKLWLGDRDEADLRAGQNLQFPNTTPAPACKPERAMPHFLNAS